MFEVDFDIILARQTTNIILRKDETQQGTTLLAFCRMLVVVERVREPLFVEHGMILVVRLMIIFFFVNPLTISTVQQPVFIFVVNYCTYVIIYRKSIKSKMRCFYYIWTHFLFR